MLEQADVLREKGWSFAMEASYLEIYNEKLRDLLAAGATHGDHAIQHKDGQTLVTGVWVVACVCITALVKTWSPRAPFESTVLERP